MIAIIPAAGHGTRFLPVTRVVPKEMLPIGAKPALELIVDEARRAGAHRIVIIISHEKEMIRTYFDGAPDIEFIYQEEQRGLGHAVLQAADAIGVGASEEMVLILLGDALVFGCDAASEMMACSRQNGHSAVIGCEKVPREKVSRYGILKLENCRVVDMVEKPSVEEAPSDLAVAGRYFLPSAIFSYLRTQTPGKGGEIQLTDAIRRMIALPESAGGCRLVAYSYPGKRQDIGNPLGYYAALSAYYEWMQSAQTKSCGTV